MEIFLGLGANYVKKRIDSSIYYFDKALASIDAIELQRNLTSNQLYRVQKYKTYVLSFLADCASQEIPKALLRKICNIKDSLLANDSTKNFAFAAQANTFLGHLYACNNDDSAIYWLSLANSMFQRIISNPSIFSHSSTLNMDASFQFQELWQMRTLIFNNYYEQAKFYNNRRALGGISNIQMAESLLDSIAIYAPDLVNDNDYFVVYFEYGNFFYDVDRNLDLAKKYFEKCNIIYNMSTTLSTYNKFMLLKKLGLMMLDLEKYEEAKEYFAAYVDGWNIEDQNEKDHRESSQLNLATAYIGMAKASYELKENDTAIHFLNKALSRLYQIDDSTFEVYKGYSIIYLELVRCYLIKDPVVYNDSVDKYIRLLLVNSKKDPQLISYYASSLSSRGVHNLNVKNYKSSIKLINRAIEAYACDDHERLAMNFKFLAYDYFFLKQYRQAMDCVDSSTNRFAQISTSISAEGYFDYLYTIANFYLELMMKTKRMESQERILKLIRECENMYIDRKEDYLDYYVFFEEFRNKLLDCKQ